MNKRLILPAVLTATLAVAVTSAGVELKNEADAAQTALAAKEREADMLADIANAEAKKAQKAEDYALRMRAEVERTRTAAATQITAEKRRAAAAERRASRSVRRQATVREAADTSIPQSGGLNWAALAKCESGGRPTAHNPSGKYHGLYQFDLPTWRAYGGSGDPHNASVAEQTRVAQNLYNARGRAPWPHCGRYL